MYAKFGVISATSTRCEILTQNSSTYYIVKAHQWCWLTWCTKRGVLWRCWQFDRQNTTDSAGEHNYNYTSTISWVTHSLNCSLYTSTSDSDAELHTVSTVHYIIYHSDAGHNCKLTLWLSLIHTVSTVHYIICHNSTQYWRHTQIYTNTTHPHTQYTQTSYTHTPHTHTHKHHTHIYHTHIHH